MSSPNEDEQLFAVMDMMFNGNKAIIPLHSKAVLMIDEIERLCLFHNINAIFMRREVGTESHVTARLL